MRHSTATTFSHYINYIFGKIFLLILNVLITKFNLNNFISSCKMLLKSYENCVLSHISKNTVPYCFVYTASFTITTVPSSKSHLTTMTTFRQTHADTKIHLFFVMIFVMRLCIAEIMYKLDYVKIRLCIDEITYR